MILARDPAQVYIAAALGDRLGTAIEFMDRKQRRKKYGSAQNYLAYADTANLRPSDETILLCEEIMAPADDLASRLAHLHAEGELFLKKAGFSARMRELIKHSATTPNEPNPHRNNRGAGFLPLLLPPILAAQNHAHLDNTVDIILSTTHLDADQTWAKRYAHALFGAYHGEPLVSSVGEPKKDELAREPNLAMAISGNIELTDNVTGNSSELIPNAIALATASKDIRDMVTLAYNTYDKADFDTLFFASAAIIGARQTKPNNSARGDLIAYCLQDRDAMLDQKDFLFAIVPELQIQDEYDSRQPRHCYTLFEHSLRTVSEVPLTLPFVRVAALLHDVAKPYVRKDEQTQATYHRHARCGSRMARHILERTGFTAGEQEHITRLIDAHVVNYSPEWSDRAVRAFAKRNDGLLDDLFCLLDADNAAQLPKGSTQPLRARILEVMTR